MIKFNLKEIREKRGYTISQMAYAMTYQVSGYGALEENTKRISPERLEQLCLILDCTPGELITYIPDKDKE